jgi:hypothetical protein
MWNLYQTFVRQSVSIIKCWCDEWFSDTYLYPWYALRDKCQYWQHDTEPHENIVDRNTRCSHVTYHVNYRWWRQSISNVWHELQIQTDDHLQDSVSMYIQVCNSLTLTAHQLHSIYATDWINYGIPLLLTLKSLFCIWFDHRSYHWVLTSDLETDFLYGIYMFSQ